MDESLAFDVDESFAAQQSRIEHLMYDIDNLIYEQNKTDPIKYLYEGLTLLRSGTNHSSCKKVRLFVYYVESSAVVPFLQFLLYKPIVGDSLLSFIEFTMTNNDDPQTKSIEILQRICHSFYEDVKYEYKGFYEDDDNDNNTTITLFYEITAISVNRLMFRMNDLWFVLLDEILNYTQVLNCFDVCDSVKTMFYNHIELGTLTDLEGNGFETPSVLFAGFRKQRLEFYATFGNPPLPVANEGCSYLFKDFEDARIDANAAARKMGDVNNGGLVRFAVFLGNMRYECENRDLLTDTSEKEEESYDSIAILKKNSPPDFYVKAYVQQCSLTFHFLDSDGNIV